MTGNRSSILSTTPAGSILGNCGWGTGGFKTIPGSGWAMAGLVAKGTSGPPVEGFGLNRFCEERFIDESVAAGVAHSAEGRRSTRIREPLGLPANCSVMTV